MRTIEIVAFPDVQLLDVCGPLQVFATANRLRAASGAVAPYHCRMVARAATVMSSAGLELTAGPLPATTGTGPDTLLAAGGDGVYLASEDRVLVDWLRRRSAEARRTASVCSGAFLLAAAGLLDGRRAATHWSRCDDLARAYPAVRVEPDPIFVRDGEVWTSAGVTAGIDLALAMIEDDLGRALALGVARHLVVFLKRPGGQAQFSAVLAAQTGEARFERLHAWIAENPGRDLSVGRLAAAVGMSERSLLRHYRRATGLTPAQGVERLRVEAARRALVESGHSIKRVATVCGFGSAETMRRAFLRVIGTTPQAFRDRFAAATPGPIVPARRIGNGAGRSKE